MVRSSFRLGTLKSGFSPKYYGNAWMGNQYAKTFNIGKVGGLLGKASLGVGILMDGVGTYNYYRYPSSLNTVSPMKFGVNTSFGIYGLYNPVASSLYFAIDAFYPGGWGVTAPFGALKF